MDEMLRAQSKKAAAEAEAEAEAARGRPTLGVRDSEVEAALEALSA